MAHIWAQKRAPNYEKWANRSTPTWFKEAKLGIFVHWGPYSVPAWAVPSGELGRMDEKTMHENNPYAEWYFNSMRFPNGPTAKHHKEVYGDAPYDDFLDAWTAKSFNAQEMVKLFAKAGAKYVVPVSKHHDGVTLWDAPGTGDRNTVHRGPKRDLIKEFADACSTEGLKFGVYYSTGIDWHVWPTKEPWQYGNENRPGIDDHAYNEYAWKHCQDLISRYKPYVLWGDIDWPKAGVAPGPHSVESLLENLYSANPDAVINADGLDRFGDTHWDFTTVEYGLGEPPKGDQMWQSTRGIGLSFGYNQVEDESHTMTGPAAVRLLVDVSAGGGNLLLNVGPDADGNLPPLQLKCIQDMGRWMDIYGDILNSSSAVPVEIAQPVGDAEPKTGSWVRWVQAGAKIYAFVDGEGEYKLAVNADFLDVASVKLVGGGELALGRDKMVTIGDLPLELGPACLSFDYISGQGYPLAT